MNFAFAVRTCLSKYFSFSGRASRPEYWWFLLFVVIGSLVFTLLDGLLFRVDAAVGDSQGTLAPLWQLAMFIPLLAAGWRRLQDAGRPGWYILLPMLVSLVSLVGLFLGIFSFGIIEQKVADPETLRWPAAVLGLGGLFAVTILQLVLTVMMLWWLTRPSELGANAYGPAQAV